MTEEIKSIKINGSLIRELKKFVAEHGGTMKEALEHGAVWVMSKGAKEYIKKLNSK